MGTAGVCLPALVALVLAGALLAAGAARAEGIEPYPGIAYPNRAYNSRCAPLGGLPKVLEVGQKLFLSAGPATDECDDPPSKISWDWSYSVTIEFRARRPDRALHGPADLAGGWQATSGSSVTAEVGCSAAEGTCSGSLTLEQGGGGQASDAAAGPGIDACSAARVVRSAAVAGRRSHCGSTGGQGGAATAPPADTDGQARPLSPAGGRHGPGGRLPSLAARTIDGSALCARRAVEVDRRNSLRCDDRAG